MGENSVERRTYFYFRGQITLGAATAEAKRLETSDASGTNLIGDRKTLHRKSKDFPSRNDEKENKQQHASAVGTIRTSGSKLLQEPQRWKGKGQKQPICHSVTPNLTENLGVRKLLKEN